jgi:hypothetical protein
LELHIPLTDFVIPIVQLGPIVLAKPVVLFQLIAAHPLLLVNAQKFADNFPEKTIQFIQFPSNVQI